MAFIYAGNDLCGGAGKQCQRAGRPPLYLSARLLLQSEEEIQIAVAHFGWILLDRRQGLGYAGDKVDAPNRGEQLHQIRWKKASVSSKSYRAGRSPVLNDTALEGRSPLILCLLLEI